MFVQSQFKRHHISSYHSAQHRLHQPLASTASSFHNSSASFGSNSSGANSHHNSAKLLARKRSAHLADSASQLRELTESKCSGGVVKDVESEIKASSKLEIRRVSDHERQRLEERRLRKRRSRSSESSALPFVGSRNNLKLNLKKQHILTNDQSNNQAAERYLVKNNCQLSETLDKLKLMKSATRSAETLIESTTSIAAATEAAPQTKKVAGPNAADYLKKAATIETTEGKQSKGGHYLRRVASFSGYSRKNLEFLSSFCLSFISYQLETWKLLVEDGTANPKPRDMTMQYAATADPLLGHQQQINSRVVSRLANELNSNLVINNRASADPMATSMSPPIGSQFNAYANEPQPAPTCGCPDSHAEGYAPVPPFHQTINRVVTLPLIDSSTRMIDTSNYHGQQQAYYDHQGQQHPYRLMPQFAHPATNGHYAPSGKINYSGYLRPPGTQYSNRMQYTPTGGQVAVPIAALNDHHLHHHNQAHLKSTLSQTNSSPAAVSLAQHHQLSHPSLAGLTGSRAHFSLVSDTPTSVSVSTNFTSNSSLDYEEAEEQTHSLRAMATQPPVRFAGRRALSLRQQSQQYPRGSSSMDLDYQYPRHQHFHTHSHHQHNYEFRHQHLNQRDHCNLQQSFVQDALQGHDSRGMQIGQATDRRPPVFRSLSQDKSTSATMGSDSELSSIGRLRIQTGDRLHYVHMPPSSHNPKRRVPMQAEASGSPRVSTRSISLNHRNGAQAPLQQSKSIDLVTSSSASNSSKKTSSITRVSLAGAKRRLGFKQKGLNSLSIHRSEEVLPAELISQRFHRTIAATSGGNLTGEDSSIEASSYLSNHSSLAASGDPRVCFVEGLGMGQIASRQALVSPYLGDIQLSLSDRRGMLEVEVIRARRLQHKPGAKRLPSPYVKVYLMRGKKCLAKFKTDQAKETLEPLYQKQFIFREFDYKDCVLQVIVWGDYGKRDKKVLMGIVQVHLNDVNISDLVIGWYRLFNAPAMASCVMSSSKMLRQTISASTIGQEVIIEQSSFESQTS